MSEQPIQRAKPVYPPAPQQDIIEVDMTTTYVMLGLLGVGVAGLGASNFYLWRKTKKNGEYLEALREYVSRLVNETECGAMAYETLIDDFESETEVADWSEDSAPYPTQQSTFQETE